MLCHGDERSPAYPRLLQLLAETRALKLTFCMLRPVRLHPSPQKQSYCHRRLLQLLARARPRLLQLLGEMQALKLTFCACNVYAMLFCYSDEAG